jgi:hypothetical protein
MATSRARTYQGWQQEQVTFLVGLTGRQAAIVAAAAVLGLQPIAAGRLATAVLAWPLAAFLVAAAFARLAGRTIDEWVMCMLSFGILRAQRKTTFLGGAFAPPQVSESAFDLPGVLAPLRLLDAEAAGGTRLAVLHHPQDGTYAAVARLTFPGIGLSDTARRDARVDAWGGVLAGLCAEGHPLTRLQVVHRAVPEHGESLRAWHVDHLDPAAPLAAALANESLLSSVAPASSQRHSWLVATMDARRAALAIRGAGGGDAGACAVLRRQLRTLEPALAGADLEVGGWLDPRELAEVIRTAFDPDAESLLEQRRATTLAAQARGQHVSGVAAGIAPALAGPAAAEASWSTYRHDGAYSVTFAIHGWPLSAVYATALAPLMAESPYRRSAAFYFEPLGPREAARRVMAERTKREVAIRLRQRTGQAVSAVERTELARAADQDADRAAGHGLIRFTGYVTVTATDPEQVDDACAELQASAAAAGIELRRMYGAQDVGFALTLPVGVGLPKRRW